MIIFCSLVLSIISDIKLYAQSLSIDVCYSPFVPVNAPLAILKKTLIISSRH